MSYGSKNYQKQGGEEWVINGEISQLDAAFTIGAESGGNVINVAVALTKPNGAALTRRQHVLAYLSGAADGSTLATAPSGGAAIGTNGLLIEPIAERAFRVVTTATGLFDINITDTGTPTMYLVVVMPDGRLEISGAITFA